jgi:hypothetical protein
MLILKANQLDFVTQFGEFWCGVRLESGQFLRVNQSESNQIRVKKRVNGFERGNWDKASENEWRMWTDAGWGVAEVGMRNGGGVELTGGFCDKGWGVGGGGLVGQSRLIKVNQTKSNRKEGHEWRGMGNGTRSQSIRFEGGSTSSQASDAPSLCGGPVQQRSIRGCCLSRNADNSVTTA